MPAVSSHSYAQQSVVVQTNSPTQRKSSTQLRRGKTLQWLSIWSRPDSSMLVPINMPRRTHIGSNSFNTKLTNLRIKNVIVPSGLNFALTTERKTQKRRTQKKTITDVTYLFRFPQPGAYWSVLLQKIFRMQSKKEVRNFQLNRALWWNSAICTQHADHCQGLREHERLHLR